MIEIHYRETLPEHGEPTVWAVITITSEDLRQRVVRGQRLPRWAAEELTETLTYVNDPSHFLVVTVGDNQLEWVVEHSYACRRAGEMAACQFVSAAEGLLRYTLCSDAPPTGRYLMKPGGGLSHNLIVEG